LATKPFNPSQDIPKNQSSSSQLASVNYFLING
jgi:hypothetical protein